MYIVVEGGDFAGKSSVIKGVLDHVKNTFDNHERLTSLSFPSKTSILGSQFRKGILPSMDNVLKDFSTYLVITNMLSEWQLACGDKLRGSGVVISDRSFYSTILYQFVKEGIPLKSLNSLKNPKHPRHQDFILVMMAANLLAPDIVIFIDADSFAIRKRMSDRGMENYYDASALDTAKMYRDFYSFCSSGDFDSVMGLCKTQYFQMKNNSLEDFSVIVNSIVKHLKKTNLFPISQNL